MTIQEAIKSGKPFGRRGKRGLFLYAMTRGTSGDKTEMRVRRYFAPAALGNSIHSFSVTDILATDWEVKP